MLPLLISCCGDNSHHVTTILHVGLRLLFVLQANNIFLLLKIRDDAELRVG